MNRYLGVTLLFVSSCGSSDETLDNSSSIRARTEVETFWTSAEVEVDTIEQATAIGLKTARPITPDEDGYNFEQVSIPEVKATEEVDASPASYRVRAPNTKKRDGSCERIKLDDAPIIYPRTTAEAIYVALLTPSDLKDLEDSAFNRRLFYAKTPQNVIEGTNPPTGWTSYIDANDERLERYACKTNQVGGFVSSATCVAVRRPGHPIGSVHVTVVDFSARAEAITRTSRTWEINVRDEDNCLALVDQSVKVNDDDSLARFRVAPEFKLGQWDQKTESEVIAFGGARTIKQQELVEGLYSRGGLLEYEDAFTFTVEYRGSLWNKFETTRVLYVETDPRGVFSAIKGEGTFDHSKDPIELTGKISGNIGTTVIDRERTLKYEDAADLMWIFGNVSNPTFRVPEAMDPGFSWL